MSDPRVFGIDLGTTYSCISHVDEYSKPVVIDNLEGDKITPSVVYFESRDNIVVGKNAKNASKIYEDRTVSFVKRSMGDPLFAREMDGTTYTPEMVSSLILRKVVGDAEQCLGLAAGDIKKVVITCPAYFGINQREATKQAGELAGLEVLDIINEPTAAAICYGLDQADGDQTVLVFDLGGGTFDVTVIEIKDSGVQVIYTDGDHELGGKDWDDRLVNLVAERFLQQNPGADDPREESQALQQLVLDAEEAKKSLTQKEKHVVFVAREKVELTREAFEASTADLLDRTIDITRRVLDQSARRGRTKVDKILLVGGSTRMPQVPRRLKEVFGYESRMFEPDLAVAKGAALYGYQLMLGNLIKVELAREFNRPIDEIDLKTADPAAKERAAEKVAASPGNVFRLGSRELLERAQIDIVNVSSKSFGIVVVSQKDRQDREVAFLIPNNTPLPAETCETGFGTLQANQREVLVQVMEQKGEAESTLLDNNRMIVDGDLAPLPPGLPAGAPIHVTFRLERNGLLKVKALEPSSGAELQLEATVEGVMSREQAEAARGLLLCKQVS